MRYKILWTTVFVMLGGVSCLPSTLSTPIPTSIPMQTLSTADVLPTQDATSAANQLATAHAEAEATYYALPSRAPSPSLTITPLEPPTYVPLDIPIPVSSLPAMPPGVESRFGPGALPNGALARFGLGYVGQARVSPDGSLLAIGNAVGVYVYDLRTMEQLWTAPTRSVVDEIDWSPDSTHLAARLFEWKNVLIWDARSGMFQHSFSHEGRVHSMAWSPDGALIVTGFGGYRNVEEGYYNPFRGFAIWDSVSGMRVLYNEYQEDFGDADYGSPVDIDWSPDGDLIAMLLGTNTVVLADAANSEFVSVLADRASMYEEYLKFSPDGHLLIAYSNIQTSDAPRSDKRAFVWDVAARKQLYVLEHNDVVSHALWSPDSSRLITSTLAWSPGVEETRIWDMTGGDLLFTVLKGELVFDSIVWSSDSQRFISSHPLDGQAIVWDAITGKADWRGFEVADLADFASPAYVGIAQDGSRLLWDSAAGVPKVALRQISPPQRIAWSPDLSHIAAISATYEREQAAIVWNVEKGEPDGFLGDVQELADWQLSTGVRDEYSHDCITGSVVAPTGQYSASYDVTEDTWDGFERDIMGAITIRESGTDKVVELQDEGSLVCVMAFSPDGSRFAAGHIPPSRAILVFPTTHIDEAYVRVWDIATQTVLYTFYGHSGIVSDMLWSPDGSLLATASADGTIIIWPVR